MPKAQECRCVKQAVRWLADSLRDGQDLRHYSYFRLKADPLVLPSAAVLAFHHAAPLLLFRLDYPDPSHHPVETVVLGIAALASWIRAELYPRLLPRIEPTSNSGSALESDLGTWQTFAFPVTSLVGAAAAAAALWVVLPAPWVVGCGMADSGGCAGAGRRLGEG